ncbi:MULTISPECIES: diaminopimelate epimerase [Enterococcus]|uniref:Diaminopimelate epimerase n=1 Tax=Enterococcus alishanensis TaxID=1303817 RepID=A0ABS6TCD8_9ENTE|nr:diaminopimelate epimerase [Enterococcus alishanensis]MBV7390565.1 diaminopimelate epimerase [Enterococcus alishanensis]
MKLAFSKMQGAGNDFILVDNMALTFNTEQLMKLARRICTRRLSIGADTMIVLEPAKKGGDFFARYFNADGSEAEMCGNGARCVARYAIEHQLAGEKMVMETIAGDVPAEKINQRIFRVQLNSPSVFTKDLALEIDGDAVLVDYVELGNPGIPHLVVRQPDLAMMETENLMDIAKKLRHHPQLEKGANVNFYDVLPDQSLVERTYERGVEDFTLACGTGTGSTAYAVVQRDLVNENLVKVEVLGGELQVEVQDDQLFLIGDTNLVAEGFVLDDDLEL